MIEGREGTRAATTEAEMNDDQMIESLLAHFGFSQFSRIQARKANLETALFRAQTHGRAKFIRCVGAGRGLSGMPGHYNSDLELFRMIA